MSFSRLAPVAFILLWSSGWVAAKFGAMVSGPLIFLSIRFAVAILDADSAPRLLYHLASGNILERRELSDPTELEPHIEHWLAERPRVTVNPDASLSVFETLTSAAFTPL